MASTNDRERKGGPGNRMFSPDPATRKQQRSWLAKLDPKNDAHLQVLASHAITPEAFDQLLARKHDDFLRLRQDELIRWERQFMEDHGVTAASTRAPAPAPLDADGPDLGEDDVE